MEAGSANSLKRSVSTINWTRCSFVQARLQKDSYPWLSNRTGYGYKPGSTAPNTQTNQRERSTERATATAKQRDATNGEPESPKKTESKQQKGESRTRKKKPETETGTGETGQRSKSQEKPAEKEGSHTRQGTAQ